MTTNGKRRIRAAHFRRPRAGRTIRYGAPILGCAAALSLASVGGCPPSDSDVLSGSMAFNNTSDPTNQGASYIGSAACSACHPDIAQTVNIHGHRHALTRVQGQPPMFPAQADRAGVPAPPDGNSWNDVSYVIGGYHRGALFVDEQGFVMTNGVEGVNTLWTLEVPPSGITPSFEAYLPTQAVPLAYDYDCFRCHATGAETQNPSSPQSQDGRPGIQGTWAEPGVGCEACHGPGSNHVPNPHIREIFVDASVRTCADCHAGGGDGDVIPAANGFVVMGAQYAELRASGAHASFACTVCHDPHVSTIYNRANGLRNTCRSCHPDQTMARHGGKTFVRDTYVEELTCESCHMPFAASTVAIASANIVGGNGRMGDSRTHIFRIRAENAGFGDMFTADGSAVVKDAEGRAAVTLDFVCLRCHTDPSAQLNNAVPLTVQSASTIAGALHDLPQ